MILPEALKGRFLHTSTILHLSLTTKCVSFGGFDIWPESYDANDIVPIAKTTVVEMCKYV